MAELLTRNYVKRAVRTRERNEVERAKRFVRFISASFPGAGIEIRLRNRRNPNGIIVRNVDEHTIVAERFVNLAWARKQGYVDAYNTSTGRKRRRSLRLPPAGTGN